MRDFQDRQNFRAIFYSRWFLAVLIIALLIMGKATWRVWQKERESRALLSEINREVEGLKERQAVLSDSIEGLSTPQGEEAEIRETFRVARPGEKLVIIVDNSSSTDESVSGNNSQGWWQKFLRFFK